MPTTDDLRNLPTADLKALAADPANCTCDPSLEGRDCDLHIILNRRFCKEF